MDIETTRRRSARRPGLWHGRYRRGPLHRWTPCPVLDVSVGRGSFEVPAGQAPRAERLQLELRPVGSALPPLTVRADVRHVRPRMEGGSVVGVEFRDLRPRDQSALDRMIRLFAT